MLLSTAAGNLAAGHLPKRMQPAGRAAGTVGAVAVSVEVFGWMTRHPRHPLARALAAPGHELQHRLGTREPTAAQLEVADAALRACLHLEQTEPGVITTRKRLAPTVFDLPVEKMRTGWYTDAYFNHTREALRYDGRRPHVVMQVFQKRHAYPRRHGRGDRDPQAVRRRLRRRSTVHALYDGDAIEPYETVLTIEGDYTTFAHLETVYLGTLARRTLITTNVVNVLRGGERQARDLHAGAARPPPRADGRRLRGVRRRADRRRARRRHDRRAGVVVGRHAASAPCRTR